MNYVKDPVLEDDDAAMILFDTLFNSSNNLSCRDVIILTVLRTILAYVV